MEQRDIAIWKPIEFSQAWDQADTSILDDLTPSWFSRRQELKEGKEDYEEFLERLKRQHAIETGIVERLYDLKEGITETFIKEGFVESYLSHDDTDIPPKQLMGFLHDHFEAMDFIFDLVKNERPLTLNFIQQLHQLVTRNQEYTEAIDSQGNGVRIELLKGIFKQSENNPRRLDGSVFICCPPVHVQAEMEKLIRIHEELWEKRTNPIIIAAWLHHAFTQIHPFQDGNGRIARLLASLILIRAQLFPFTVKRDEKPRYISALEAADRLIPQELVTFFCEEQKRHIEDALNYKAERIQASISDVARLFTEKIDVLTSQKREERQARLQNNRSNIFNIVYSLLGSVQSELFEFITKDRAIINLTSARLEDDKHHWYTQQIVKYANVHDYYFGNYIAVGTRDEKALPEIGGHILYPALNHTSNFFTFNRCKRIIFEPLSCINIIVSKITEYVRPSWTLQFDACGIIAAIRRGILRETFPIHNR